MSNKNKRGQVGDTVTWIIATIIIVVMIFFFVFGSSLLAETKEVHKFRGKIISEESEVNYDLILSKSLYTYIKIDTIKTKNEFYMNLEDMEAKGKFQDSLEERKTELERGVF